MPTFPIACQITALNPEQKAQRKRIAQKLFEATNKVQELKNGYAFAYSLEKISWMDIAKFIDLESQCCPFFTFSIQLSPEDNSIQLQLTGKAGVKEFIQTHEDFAV